MRGRPSGVPFGAITISFAIALLILIAFGAWIRGLPAGAQEPQPTRYPYPVQTIWADGTATAGTGTAQWLTAYARWLNTTPEAPWPFAQITSTLTTTPTIAPDRTATARAGGIQTAISILQTALAITQTATPRSTLTPSSTPPPSETPSPPPSSTIAVTPTPSPTSTHTPAPPVYRGYLPFSYRYKRPTPRPRR